MRGGSKNATAADSGPPRKQSPHTSSEISALQKRVPLILPLLDENNNQIVPPLKWMYSTFSVSYRERVTCWCKSKDPFSKGYTAFVKGLYLHHVNTSCTYHTTLFLSFSYRLLSCSPSTWRAVETDGDGRSTAKNRQILQSSK